jgi:glucose-6-phosphate-specific signal transduction histidine kinase
VRIFQQLRLGARAHRFEHRFVIVECRQNQDLRNGTGLSGDFSAEGEPPRFGDERAETLLRMQQEALRNVERHAKASRVAVRLQFCVSLRLSPVSFTPM